VLQADSPALVLLENQQPGYQKAADGKKEAHTEVTIE